MLELARQLFAEFADSYARGERPDVGRYVERAGEERHVLARMLEGFLQGVPAKTAAPEDAALLAAWLGADPPLLELRRRRGLRVDEVVDGLAVALGIEGGRRARLKLQYQRLEGGVLDPSGVAERVWDSLTETLGRSARELARSWRAPAAPAAAYLRSDLDVAPPAAVVEPAPDPEIDALFTAAADG